jgi:hypothetical protein
MRLVVLLAAGLLLLSTGSQTLRPATADATQRVTLETTFSPDRLGQPTTIEFGFHVLSTTAGQVPSPVTDVALDLPAGMGLATSTLGLAQCQSATLLERGLEGCRANAHVGVGFATGQVSIEGEIVTETATVYALLGPSVGGNEQILFYLDANEPVSAQLIFPGQILPPLSPGFGGRLDTTIPLVPTWHNGPDIAVTSFSSTLGPRGLIYFRHVHGEIVPFRPRGISVPVRCPRDGFPFAASFTFLDGSHTSAGSSVACPRVKSRSRMTR